MRWHLHRTRGILATAKSIVATEGVRGLYAGMTAQLLRAWTYAPARFGVFLTLEEALRPPGGALPFVQKTACGFAAGAAAAIISNPAEVAIVRMQVDKSLPVLERRNYKNVGDALVRAAREESVSTLWKGSAPNALRAMALNGGAMASHSQTKEAIDAWLGTENGTAAGIGGALMSGVVRTYRQLPPARGTELLKSHVAGYFVVKSNYHSSIILTICV